MVFNIQNFSGIQVTASGIPTLGPLYLQTIITGGGGTGSGTFIQVTGSNFLTGLNLFGISGISLFLSGNRLFINGGGVTGSGGTGNYVVNNQSNVTFGTANLNSIQFGDDSTIQQGYFTTSITNQVLFWDTQQQLLDNGTHNIISLDWGNRLIYDANGTTSIDYSNRILTGSWHAQNINLSGFSVVTTNQTGGFGGGTTGNFVGISNTQTISGLKTFSTGLVISSGSYISGSNGYLGLIDGSKTISVDWINRNLINPNGVSLINWSNSNIYDTNSRFCIDWGNRILYDSTVLNAGAINWNTRYLGDDINGYSVRWGTGKAGRLLVDSGQANALDWQNRVLSGSWLTQNLNVTGKFNPSGGFLTDNNNLTCIDLNNRLAYDNAGNQNIAWSNGNRILSIGSLIALDWGNYLLWYNGSNQRLNWGASPQFYGLWQYSQLSGTNLYANSINLGIKTLTGNYTLTSNDSTILFSGNNLTGTLPSAITNSGINYNVKNIFGSLIITGSQNIDASNNYTNFNVNKGVQLQSNGIQWQIINHEPTGQLTGQFYPLNSNPSGYISNYTQSGAYLFTTQINSGVTQQFIVFPTNLGSNPYIMCTLANTGSNENILVWPSGITSSGYYAQFSWPTDNNAYVLTTLASLSVSSGLATTVVIYNVSGGPFYPLNSNPSNYVTSSQTGGFGTGGSVNTGNLTGVFFALYSNNIVSGNNVFSGNCNFYGNSCSFQNGLVVNNGITVGGTSEFTSSVLFVGADILDGTAFNSIDPTNRILYNSVGNPTLYYSNLLLTGGTWNSQGLQVSGSNVITANQTGQFITTGQTGNFGKAGGSNTGAYIFTTAAISGSGHQFISFPTNLGNGPYVIPSLNNYSGSGIITVQSSGITSSGYWAQYSVPINSSGYVLTTLASLSTSTGLATTVVVTNNNTNNITITGTQVQITGSSYLTGTNFSGIGGTQLILSGNYTLISGGAGGGGGGGGNFSTGQLYIPPSSLSFNSTSVTLNWQTGDHFFITLTGNTNISFTGTQDAMTIVVATYDTGAGYTVTFPTGKGNNFSGIKWPGGTGFIPIQTSGQTDLYTFTQFLTGIYANVIQNY